jgi:hypothetical protein
MLYGTGAYALSATAARAWLDALPFTAPADRHICGIPSLLHLSRRQQDAVARERLDGVHTVRETTPVLHFNKYIHNTSENQSSSPDESRTSTALGRPSSSALPAAGRRLAEASRFPVLSSRFAPGTGTAAAAAAVPGGWEALCIEADIASASCSCASSPSPAAAAPVRDHPSARDIANARCSCASSSSSSASSSTSSPPSPPGNTTRRPSRQHSITELTHENARDTVDTASYLCLLHLLARGRPFSYRPHAHLAANRHPLMNLRRCHRLQRHWSQPPPPQLGRPAARAAQPVLPASRPPSRRWSCVVSVPAGCHRRHPPAHCPHHRRLPPPTAAAAYSWRGGRLTSQRPQPSALRRRRRLGGCGAAQCATAAPRSSGNSSHRVGTRRGRAPHRRPQIRAPGTAAT